MLHPKSEVCSQHHHYHLRNILNSEFPDLLILWQVILTHVQVWEVLCYSFKVHTVGTYSLPYTVLGFP